MTTKTFDRIQTKSTGQITEILVDRPDKLNALDRKTMEQIDEAFSDALNDDSVRVIVIGGTGEKAFVAGADIKEMASLSAAEAQRFSQFLQRVLEKIERSPKPVIAKIQGFALGGGCELAMACHLRIGSTHATLGQPEVNLGLIPGAGGTQRLPRLIGRGRALDLILTGRLVKADEAQAMGLLNQVVEPEALDESVEKLAKTLLSKSPMAHARALEAVLSGEEISQSEAMRLEASLFGLGFATEDMKEGTQAFLEKRTAEFTGS